MMNMLQKFLFSLAIFSLVFSFSTCASSPVQISDSISNSSDNFIDITQNGLIMQAYIAPKDFTSLGLIFVESSAVIAPDGKIIAGSKITFEMLMREAFKLGADDIINIKIDEIENFSVTEETKIVSKRVRNPNTGAYQTVDRESIVRTSTRTVDYKANALAIKYTGAVAIPIPTVNINDMQNNQYESNTGTNAVDILRNIR